MRINVYSQELLTDPAKSEARFADDVQLDPVVELLSAGSNTEVTYSAVRMFLHSSDRLHHPPEDDDRSAITFWLPRSADRRERLAQTFEELANLVRCAPPETGLD